MFEIHNAVGNEDSRLSGKETLGTDDIVLKRSGVRRCYGLGSGEGRKRGGRHENVLWEDRQMRLHRGGNGAP